MTYAPLDDNFDDHPKYMKLGPAHMGLIACGITYCTRHLTDGVIPRKWPGSRFGHQGGSLARSLVVRGIWRERSDGDFEIVGYLDHNPSKSEVEAKRESKQRAGRIGGQASAQARGQAPASSNLQAPPEPTSLHSTPLEERERERSTPSALLSTGLGAKVESVTPLADEVHRDRAREQITRLAEWAKTNGVDR